MAELNHTIVWCQDKQRSAGFLSEILGLPPPEPFLHFLVVRFANDVSMDFYQKDGEIALQHYAFLVSDPEFDQVMERILAHNLDHWADPAREKPGEINRHWGGRGVYFMDPDGHLLEAITQPYGAAEDL